MLSIQNLLLPYDTDTDMCEEVMEVDDQFQIVSDECQAFTGGVQSLVSMTNIKNIQQVILRNLTGIPKKLLTDVR